MSVGLAFRQKYQDVTFPCMNPKLVPAAKVQANEYNPNKVAVNEMELLKQSIEADGVTMPIVTYYDVAIDRYIVVDGFHRYILLTKHFGCQEVPVVAIDKNIQDRMASTVRHNRARGKHQADLMAELVKAMIQRGCTDDEIAEHLGMTGDELVRLKQVVGIAKLFAIPEYTRAWGESDEI